MAKSVIFWIYVTHFCYLLRPVRTGTTYTSRACYGSDPPCVQHSINCSDTQKIAIVDAYYTSNTECGAGVSDCSTVNLDNITEKGYHSFNKTELDSLNKICSTGFQCVYPAPWRGASRTFSVVKYQCTEGPLLNVNGAAEMKVSQVSLIYEDKARHSPTVIRSDGFVCNFTSSVSVSKMSVYLLDSRLGRTQGQCLADLSVLRGNYITTNNFSGPFTPFKRLNVTWSSGLQQIFFKDSQSLSTGIIWLLINASDPFNVKCETLDRTTAENIPESPKITSTHNSLAPGTTDNNDTVAGEAVNNTGAIVGGVVATVVAVLVVTLVSVWFLRYRRTQSEVKEKPATVSTDVKPDMTYSLARKIPQENYHEIKDMRTHNNDYDYATADGVNLPLTTDNYFTIEPVGKLTVTANSMACTTESDYDHIGDKPTPPTSDYDTTASVAQPGHIAEDSYGYNHFQNKINSQTHQNDYDTAASATKAVASISTAEKKTAEDDYDHFHKATNAAKTVSSPYDTTSRVEDNSDYFVAGQME
ncbi:uncharacterized protein [Haliotis asinina]|uniref:uncharacterized protein isoform X2 n=1 Tax=Haliotis asinina TaxID=109174 RepID=UPI0035327668